MIFHSSQFSIKMDRRTSNQSPHTIPNPMFSRFANKGPGIQRICILQLGVQLRGGGSKCCKGKAPRDETDENPIDVSMEGAAEPHHSAEDHKLTAITIIILSI